MLFVVVGGVGRTLIETRLKVKNVSCTSHILMGMAHIYVFNCHLLMHQIIGDLYFEEYLISFG